MPYLPPEIKRRIEENPVYGRGDPTILTYRISQVVQRWLAMEPTYADYAGALGAIALAQEELFSSINIREEAAKKFYGDTIKETNPLKDNDDS